MEIKAQITKKLQKYKADEIKTLYQLMLRVLSGSDSTAGDQRKRPEQSPATFV